MSPPFEFTADVSALNFGDALVVEVPPGLKDKSSLLSWYARAASFPDYFGHNWDAFDECLRDLSWLGENRLVLYHRDVPLAGSSADQKIYLDVLTRAVADWKPGEGHEVVVAFDKRCEPRVRALYST